MLIELTLKEKIEVIKTTISYIKSKDYRCECGSCGAIFLIMLRKFKNISYLDVSFLFPEFNRKNATLLSEKYDFEAPTGSVYWWEFTDKNIRIKFLESLLLELYESREKTFWERLFELIIKKNPLYELKR